MLHLDLDMPDEDGVTKRQRANSMKKYGKKDARLEVQIEIPECARKAYNIFMELNSSRTNNGFGMNALSFTEIKAYCDLHSQVLLSWEVSAIKHLDGVFMKFIKNRKA